MMSRSLAMPAARRSPCAERLRFRAAQRVRRVEDDDLFLLAGRQRQGIDQLAERVAVGLELRLVVQDVPGRDRDRLVHRQVLLVIRRILPSDWIVQVYRLPRELLLAAHQFVVGLRAWQHARIQARLQLLGKGLDQPERLVAIRIRLGHDDVELLNDTLRRGQRRIQLGDGCVRGEIAYRLQLGIDVENDLRQITVGYARMVNSRDERGRRANNLRQQHRPYAAQRNVDLLQGVVGDVRVGGADDGLVVEFAQRAVGRGEIDATAADVL